MVNRRRLTLHTPGRFGSLALLCLLWLVACRRPATQIVLFVDTDAPLDRPVNVEVFSFAGAVPTTDIATRANAVVMGSLRLVRGNNGRDTFTAGGSIGVIPPADTSINAVTVWVRASIAASATAPAVLMDRAALLTFVRGRAGTARISLPIRCGDASVGCSSVSAAECTVSVRCREQGATCGDMGECVAPEVAVATAENDGAVEDTPSRMIDAISARGCAVRPNGYTKRDGCAYGHGRA